MAAAFEGSNDQILLEAGSDPSLLTLQGEEAPLELLTEFLRCIRSEEFIAAKLLCQKVLTLEPDNNIAQEFLPNIEERIVLDRELPTESSSDESEDESGEGTSESESDSEDDSHENKHDCCHGNHD